MSKIAQVLFTRVPVPGRTKKRLMPFLTPQQAADLHEAMIYDTLHVMQRAKADLLICYEPSIKKVFFEELVRRQSIYPQRGKLLSKKVINCFVDMHEKGYKGGLLLVSDTPTVQTCYLQKAIRVLQEPHPVVAIGPSHDRGVYLIGTNRLDQLKYLEKIPWSKSSILELLLANIRETDLSLRFLPVVKDIDEKQDVYWLLSECARVSKDELKHVKSFFRKQGKSIFSLVSDA